MQISPSPPFCRTLLLVDFLLDLLFPKKCFGCKKPGGYLCISCQQGILQTELVCPKCEKLAVGGQTHPICRRRFGLDGLWSLGAYKDPLRTVIKKLKYSYIEELGLILTDLTLEYWARFEPYLLEKIKKDGGQNWIVIPVPLHWYRENYRGFNQSSLIGKQLALKLGLKYVDALKRTKYTSPQVKLKSSQRYQNTKNAFEITKPYTLNPIPFVLLIDDVWTTGATLKECCYILKRAGAKQVWALTIAR